MKKLTFTGKMTSCKRMNNSVVGNPRYYGVFENADGETLEGKTATNAACAYSFENCIDQPRTLEYHVTRSGNVIIDRICFK